MSILLVCQEGWFISHKNYLDEMYKNVVNGSSTKKFVCKDSIFKINSPYTKKKALKRKFYEEKKLDGFIRDIEFVKSSFEVIYKRIADENLWEGSIDESCSNNHALETAQSVYSITERCSQINLYGKNDSNAVMEPINGCKYLFPENCRFYCKNVNEIGQHLLGEQFNLILLDPPWWNKYIRRKKAKTNHGYKMMHSEELCSLPIKNLIKHDSLVVVWCTNSTQHNDTLIEKVFPQWDVKFVCKWFWVKVTSKGEPICNFALPPGKQPFEQIVIGCHKNADNISIPAESKLIVSIPSALHSNKPPLIELLKPYMCERPKCLEIFARYLLKDWTSFGLEVLRFQHECLYEEY